jgi:transposase
MVCQAEGMKAYSADLRGRVMGAVGRGERREDVAARFEVSVPTVERWVRLERETGGLARRPVPGPVAVKTAGLPDALPDRLATHADATLGEQCEWWRAVSGFEVSTATMSRALTRLAWTREKSRSAPASGTRPSGQPGATR